jgi:hypothetical protein
MLRKDNVTIHTILLSLDIGQDELLRCIWADKSEIGSLARLELNTRISNELF